MGNKTRTALGLAIAATLGATAADAALYSATLTSFQTFSNNGASNGNITSSTATWQYDDVTGIMTQSGGTLNVRFTTTPTTTLFRYLTTGLTIGAGGAASATTYTCQEGNFGGNVGANLCGNYTFGANYANDSTLVYSGSSVTRTMGGDDAALGPPQSVADLGGMSTVSWVGTTLTLSNGVCTLSPAANCTTITGAPLYNKGMQLVFNAGPQAVVPVPAAAWLLGPAVLAAGRFARRRKIS
ncbi:MAG: hypothetical protein HRU81_07960 [Gammaproteobacteria bacterium]|nr:MAG: hypothetical protein HRU81_07960 [Gammaproteobacteria bacterium]